MRGSLNFHSVSWFPFHSLTLVQKVPEILDFTLVKTIRALERTRSAFPLVGPIG